MASIADILRTIGAEINSGITAAGITTQGQVVVGWPTAPQGAAIWGAGQWLITLYPQKTRPNTRYKTTPGFINAPTVCPLVATVVPTSSTVQTVTFTGANAAGLNVWTTAGATQIGSLYQTTGAESFAQIATAIAANLTALGITASASGPSFSVTGKFAVYCNVGQPTLATPATGYAQYVAEVARFTRDVQVTIWASIPDIGPGNNDGSRENLENAMLQSVGGRDQPWLYAPDASSFSALWQSAGDWSDKAESSYTVFRSDNFLTIDYPLLKPLTETPVGVISATTQIGAHSATTEIIGGPLV